VPMMEHTEHHAYAERRDAQVLELAYVGGTLAMRLAIPRERAGLAKMEPLARDLLALPLRAALVHLAMPRFGCESRFTLEEQLAAMGMPSLFRTPDADLSGIDGTRDLYVSRVVHQALANVDEAGTEAAAATATATEAAFFGAPGRPEPVIEVRVDRPFLFWIVDRPTGTVLFAGRVVEPVRAPSTT
jgi:serpin B